MPPGTDIENPVLHPQLELLGDQSKRYDKIRDKSRTLERSGLKSRRLFALLWTSPAGHPVRRALDGISLKSKRPLCADLLGALGARRASGRRT